jgi:hypothetical protein
MMLLAAGWFFVIGTAPAEEEHSKGTGSTVDAHTAAGRDPEHQEKNGSYSIVILSKSTINELTAGKHVARRQKIDAAISKKISFELQAHGLSAGPAAEEDLKARGYQHLLSYKMENVVFGFRNPFGRATNLKVSYVLQSRDGRIVRTGAFEEHSKKSWKNCVRSITRDLSDEVADAVSGNYSEKAGHGADKRRDRNKTPEERLQQLDELKAKGMVTPEEYKKKREEILKHL